MGGGFGGRRLRIRVGLLCCHQRQLTSCSVRLSLSSRVLTAVQSCCISLSGTASIPGGKDSSSLPKPSPELQSAGSRLVGRPGSLEKWQSERARRVVVGGGGKKDTLCEFTSMGKVNKAADASSSSSTAVEQPEGRVQRFR